jgi:hypothetical protein
VRRSPFRQDPSGIIIQVFGVRGAEVSMGDLHISLSGPEPENWSIPIVSGATLEAYSAPWQKPADQLGANPNRSDKSDKPSTNGKTSASQSVNPATALDLAHENATKKLSVAIPKNLHRTLKQMALDQDLTMGELITDMLQDNLNSKKP